MRRRLLWALCLCLLLNMAVLPAFAASDGQAAGGSLPDGTFVARIYYNEQTNFRLLAQYDLFEYNNRQEKYLLAAVDAAQFRDLQDQGFRIEVDEQETAAFLYRPPVSPDQINGIPGYTCYRTVEETFSTAQSIVAAHPTLASWIDIGDTWEKVTPGGAAGYDMMVLKLTNSAVAGPKPKLLITGSIHAREYTPAEMVTRFAEYLINNYNVDADATWLLDYNEIHLVLQTNPDGRKQAETGLSWRKNTNQNYCGATSTSRGADLNRNFSFQWGCCGGSSPSQCNETYRGPSAASEPEVQAIQAYMRAIFPDQRGPLLTDPAPADASGVYLDLHSYSELVLWPWGFTTTTAPNATALQTLGRKYAYFNNYTPEQSIALYATDGTTDDFAYGDLGVSGMTFEMGTAFFQSCTTFNNTIVPANMPALIYAAKVARTPYQTPAGPDALSVTATPATVTQGQSIVLTASINDTRYRNTNGTEPTQAIAAAEYYVDLPPWVSGASAKAMAATDGAFNSTVENVTATLNTASLSVGRHIVFVRGRDAANNWGAFSAVFINVNAPLAVTLAGFAAQQQGAAVEVTWETVSELDNASFNVYRAESGDGAKTLVAAVPSQAPGSAQGASYRIVDADVQAGRTYWYSLEDVDLSGTATLHGPVSVALQAPAAVTMSHLHTAPRPASGVPWPPVLAAILLALAASARRRAW